jgi:CheY-like chemotaxis protein
MLLICINSRPQEAPPRSFMRSDSTGDRPLVGITVLVVEDDGIVGLDLRFALEAAGACVLGPASSVDEAIGLLQQPLDVAVLDVDLDTEKSFPIALILLARQVPFVFLTGFPESDLIPQSLRSVPILSKPLPCPELVRSLVALG